MQSSGAQQLQTIYVRMSNFFTIDCRQFSPILFALGRNLLATLHKMLHQWSDMFQDFRFSLQLSVPIFAEEQNPNGGARAWPYLANLSL